MDCYLYLKEQISKFPSEKAFLHDLAYYIDRVQFADAVQPDNRSYEGGSKSPNSPRSERLDSGRSVSIPSHCKTTNRRV